MKRIELNVEEITVVCHKDSEDRIFIRFEAILPSPLMPWKKSTLQMDVARGTGLEYVRQVFDFEPRVVKY